MTGIELAGLPAEARGGHQVTLAARRRGAIVRPLGDVVVLMPPLSIDAPTLHAARGDRGRVDRRGHSVRAARSRRVGDGPGSPRDRALPVRAGLVTLARMAVSDAGPAGAGGGRRSVARRAAPVVVVTRRDHRRDLYRPGRNLAGVHARTGVRQCLPAGARAFGRSLRERTPAVRRTRLPARPRCVVLLGHPQPGQRQHRVPVVVDDEDCWKARADYPGGEDPLPLSAAGCVGLRDQIRPMQRAMDAFSNAAED